ncbi:MAG: AsmA family protein [Magnetococcales bacterium]|nr:AsmA family protein [Magnetococcales bacterium]
MKKWLWIILVPVVLIVAAAVVVPSLIDPNQYKQQISTLVKEKTGRDLTVNGAIKITVFPSAGVSLEDVTLGDAPGFGAEPMAKVARLDVRAKLMPLLSKRVEADKVVVEGLRLKLAKNAKGQANWSDLTGPKSAPAATPTTDKAATPADKKPAAPTGEKSAPATAQTAKPAEAPASGAGGTGLASITLAGVEIRDAQVSWDNAVSGAQYTFKKVRLVTGELAPGQPVALEFESDVERIKPATNAHLSLTATVRPSADGKGVQLQKTNLGLTLKGGEGSPVTSADLRLAADIDALLDGSMVKAQGLDLTVKSEGGPAPLAKAESKLRGQLEVTSTTIRLSGVSLDLKGDGKPGAAFGHLEALYKGDIDGQRQGMNLVLPAMELTLKADGGTLPAGGADLKLTARAEVDGLKQTARLTALKVEGMEQLKAEGGLNVSRFAPLTLSGDLDLQPLNLRTLLTKLGHKLPATADDKSLTALKVKTGFALDGQKVGLNRLEAKLDDTQLKGNVTWPLGGGNTMRVDLEVDTLDLDRYLPPKAASSGGDSKPAEAGPKPADSAPKPAPSGEGGEIPVEPLKKLDMDGKIHIGQLKFGSGKFQDAQVVLKGKDGLLKLEPASVKLYGGSTRIDATLDVRGQVPMLTLKQNLQGVQIGPLLKDLANEESLTGTANLDVDVRSTGRNLAAIKQDLDGKVGFVVKDGAYLKMDLNHSIRQAYGAYAATRGRALSVGEDTGRTPFTSLDGSAEINNGLLESKNIQAVSPALKLTGAGKVDLPKNQLDFTFKANVLALDDVDTQSVKDLKGIAIPVRIHGDLAHPAKQIDLEGLIAEGLKTKAMEKVQEKLGGKLGDALGGKLGERLGIKGAEKPAQPSGDANTAPSGSGGKSAPLDELKKVLPFGR